MEKINTGSTGAGLSKTVFTVKVKSIQHLTHDVLQIVTEKPVHFKFTPGQATEISINKEGWQNEKRPFTFTCLPDNEMSPYN